MRTAIRAKVPRLRQRHRGVAGQLKPPMHWLYKYCNQDGAKTELSVRYALWDVFLLLFLGDSLSYLRQDSYELLWALPRLFGPRAYGRSFDQISRLEIARRNTRFDIACMHDGGVKAGLLCQVMVCPKGLSGLLSRLGPMRWVFVVPAKAFLREGFEGCC